ncbi:glycosyltransferase [Lutibacter sp. HS1-25]|uniref:glycosyltransferase family 2 protein n=1 Tax=Lutibacter sp. HS1-25 TaxID=2485000 RepID=UPI001011B8D2|nr:glycosyltransferase family 2 protein [Lutibacter sp. HS1-25]RXP45397.1 glycosyltransferase [Lutibacter sp. HS1-25]RXP48600.1 glycosyltransferase [Lutibacter sp. HS1-25]
MKISIITVCYNSAATIEKTIQSVAAQTYNNIEYLIIDGNSKDATLTIIKKYDTVITKWVSEPDKGLYDAMNKGIALATGDIVGILNSDDTFFNNQVLEEVANFHTNNTIDASVGNIVQHNATGKIKRVYSAANWHPEKLKIGFMAPHPAIFFKRDLFSQFGNYELDYIIAADYELIIRFFLKHKITWKYSGITTTAMLVGGVSSSGYNSYNIITKEIKKGFDFNKIKYAPSKVRFRAVWKIIGLLKK